MAAVVAASGGSVIGVALATISGDRAWVTRIAVDPEHRRQGVSAGLLSALERRVLDRGVRRLAYVMEAEKTLIERRVVLPLQEPERANAHGVLPPRAIVLFGPPGTGKTTFARGVASRLSWPFVEIFPSRLAAGPDGLAHALRDVFARLGDLERVVVFLDEVEEIAPMRGSDPTSPAHGVTNELLKLIPGFRERDTRLLVAATNSIRSSCTGSAADRRGRPLRTTSTR